MSTTLQQTVEAIQSLVEAASVTVSGHRSGREHHPELHLCESCATNIAALQLAIKEVKQAMKIVDKHDAPLEIECNCAPEYSHLCWKCGGTGYLKQ